MTPRSVWDATPKARAQFQEAVAALGGAIDRGESKPTPCEVRAMLSICHFWRLPEEAAIVRSWGINPRRACV